MDEFSVRYANTEYVLSRYRSELGESEIVFQKDGWVSPQENLIGSIKQLDILGKNSFNVRIKEDGIETFLVENNIKEFSRVYISEVGKTKYCPANSIIFVLEDDTKINELTKLAQSDKWTKIEQAPIYLLSYPSFQIALNEYTHLKDNAELPKWIKCFEINNYTFEEGYIQRINTLSKEQVGLPPQMAYRQISLVDEEGNRKHYGDKGIKIAVFDLGVDKDHPDIKKAVPLKNYGFDYVRNCKNVAPDEEDHHGTQCAGLIVGTSDGTNGVEGVAKHCMLFDYRIGYIRHPSAVKTNYFGIIQALYRAALLDGVDIINCSWGNDKESPTIAYAINDIFDRGRNGKGAIVVAAAGNDGEDVSFPANLKNVIGVTAVNERNEPKRCSKERCWASNFGKGANVAAPGKGLVTCRNWNINNAYTTNFYGTSASAPLVSGALALLLSKKTDLRSEQIREVFNNKDSFDDFAIPTVENYGIGVLNIEKLLNI